MRESFLYDALLVIWGFVLGVIAAWDYKRSNRPFGLVVFIGDNMQTIAPGASAPFKVLVVNKAGKVLDGVAPPSDTAVTSSDPGITVSYDPASNAGAANGVTDGASANLVAASASLPSFAPTPVTCADTVPAGLVVSFA